MRIRSVRIGAAKTINLGNSNAIRVDAYLTADLAEGEELQEVEPRLQGELKRLLEETYRSQRKEQQTEGNGR